MTHPLKRVSGHLAPPNDQSRWKTSIKLRLETIQHKIKILKFAKQQKLIPNKTQY